MKRKCVPTFGDKGSITVFFSLLFVFYVGFYFVLLESARVYGLEWVAQEQTDSGVDAVMAEWSREVYENYGLYMLDLGYGSAKQQLEMSEEKFCSYANNSVQNMQGMNFFSVDITAANIVALDSALSIEAFQNAILTSLKEDNLLSKLQILLDNQQVFDDEREGEVLIEEAQKVYEMDEEELKELNWLDNFKLQMLLPDSAEISEAGIKKNSLPSALLKDYSASDSGTIRKNIPTVAFLNKYICNYFTCFTDDLDSNSMQYQIEYILYGKATDKENLSVVVNRLLALRTALNLLQIRASVTKVAEVEAFAASLTIWNPTIVALPAITLLLESAWAWGEALCDVSALLAGNCVPLQKTEAQWQLSLEAALLAGKGANSELMYENHSQGFTYKEYLSLLLLLKDTSQLTLRVMDVIQDQIQESVPAFYLKNCIFGMEVESVIQAQPMFFSSIFVSENQVKYYTWRKKAAWKYYKN